MTMHVAWARMLLLCPRSIMGSAWRNVSSQKPVTGPYPEPVKFRPHHHDAIPQDSLIYIQISQVVCSSRVYRSKSCMHTKFLLWLVAIYPAHIILEITNLMMLDVDCKVHIFHHPITSSLLGLNILLTPSFLHFLYADVEAILGGATT
jgi:hypothetical protein